MIFIFWLESGHLDLLRTSQSRYFRHALLPLAIDDADIFVAPSLSFPVTSLAEVAEVSITL